MIQIFQTNLPNLELDILAVNPSKTKQVELNCLIDTGFYGFLSIPKYLGEKFGLEVFAKIKLHLASGYTDFAEVAKILVNFPKGGYDYLMVDVILDEEGEDVLVGSGFLEMFCEKFNYDLLISFLDKKLNFIEKI